MESRNKKNKFKQAHKSKALKINKREIMIYLHLFKCS
jgi:hypothetical protein